MKIYFAGSITGGRDDANFYLQIIQLLQKYGTVLTEHIGKVDLSDKGEVLAAKYIFKRDVAWLAKADWIVAEVTQPSLGVGYELGISEKLGKNVLCLFRPSSTRRLSAMIVGNDAVRVAEYENIEELEEIFNKYLK
jgi:2'-deoxynucleoside 5'-phosphate N-hydrolase